MAETVRRNPMKMYVWTDRFSFLAVAHAGTVAEARKAMLGEMGESGDGSCPERDKARRCVLGDGPSIFMGVDAEFCLSDSAELREQEAYLERVQAELKAVKDMALVALRAAEGHLSETLTDRQWHPIGHCPVLDLVRAAIARAEGKQVAVYVDNYRASFGRMVMCHMVADTTDELLAMADRIGVQRKWIQKAGTFYEHFDICLSKREKAVRAGAIELRLGEFGRFADGKTGIY